MAGALLLLLLYAAPARAGAGFGELCDVQVPVAHGFYWSENLHDLIGPFASVSNIRAVA